MKSRAIHIVLLLLNCSASTWATSYFVDNVNGNDNYNGLTVSTAWQSLSKVNAFSYQPGDSILFKRGGQWRGQLIPKSGTVAAYITYADYGTGQKPQLLGSVNVSGNSQWIDEGGNIWRSAQSSPIDIGNLIFNGATGFGSKKWTASQLLTQGDYWWDESGTQTVKIYSTLNPANYYSDIEAAIGTFIVYIQQGSYIVLKNLACKYGAADGIELRNAHHIIISDCELSYIGGCKLINQVRYGGGIQFWANSNNNIVERCKIWEIYDDAITNQGNSSAGGTLQQYKLYFRNNIIWNCSESSFCFFIQPAIVNGSFMKNIYFENNTCVNAGGGWAANQRPDLKGFQVYCSANTAATDSVFIRNNIFYKSRCVFFVDNSAVQTLAFTNSDYNCWYPRNTTDTVVALWTNTSLNVWTANQFTNYQTTTNRELHSFISNPLLVNPGNNDYYPAPNSPCIDAGTNTGITTDFALNPRPQNGNYDMGAYEYLSGTIGTTENKNEDDVLRIYPNPNTGLFTVEGTAAQTEIRIYNSIGSMVFTTTITNKQCTIDLSGQAKGLYFVSALKNSQEIHTQKLIILKE